jgi:hypothetical protein
VLLLELPLLVSDELDCCGRELELLETESERVFGVPVCELSLPVLCCCAEFLPLTASCSLLPCLPLGVAESEPHCLPCFFIDVSAFTCWRCPAREESCWAWAAAATPTRSIAVATIALLVFMSPSWPVGPKRS